MSDDFEPACRRMEWLDPFYKQVWEKAFAEGIPISGTFELTPRCNFSCKMCYVHLKPEEIPQNGVELTAKEWLRIAKEAKAAGTTWVCVTGGEPLLHPEFPEIWQSLTEMGFFLTLQTNASLVRGKMLDLLERCPPRQAKVTLYGSDDEVYQAVCGVEQGFTRVNEGIHNLMSVGIPVTLVSTVIRQNQDDVERMAFVNGNPFSEPAELRNVLRSVALCSTALPQLDVAVSTGVHDGEAAVKALLCGANAVQVCSAIHEKGFGVIADINRFIEQWAERHGFESLGEFRGRMDYGNAESDVYQRVQYMKYFPHDAE